MERTWLPEAETRLTLLYCLRGLGPVTAEQLERFLLTLGLVNYFDLRLNLSALGELGQIRTLERPAGPLLHPAEEGERALAAFAGRIPRSRRELIDQAAPLWQARFRREQECLADLPEGEDGRVFLRLRLAERNGGVPMELLLPWQGPCPREAWMERAPVIFGEVLGALTGGTENGPEPPGQSPERLRLQQGDFTLILAPGSRILQDRARERWPLEAERLERMIRRTLTEG